MYFYRIFSSFLGSLWHGIFPGKLKGRVNMSRNRVRFTVEEVFAHLDVDFDTRDEVINSVNGSLLTILRILSLFCLRTQSFYPTRRKRE